MRRIVLFMLGAFCALGRVHSHFPSLHAYAFDCDSVRRAAKQYLETRGIILREPSPAERNRHWQWTCGTTRCPYPLEVPQLLDEFGTVMSWPAVREKYFWPLNSNLAFDEKRIWARERGYWETASKWKMFGEIELETTESGCTARVDFSYVREINQFLVIFPTDAYPQGLLSNNRLEDESIAGIEQILTKR